MENRVLSQERSLNSRYYQIEIKSDMTKAKCIIQCLIEIQEVKAEESSVESHDLRILHFLKLLQTSHSQTKTSLK